MPDERAVRWRRRVVVTTRSPPVRGLSRDFSSRARTTELFRSARKRVGRSGALSPRRTFLRASRPHRSSGHGRVAEGRSACTGTNATPARRSSRRWSGPDLRPRAHAPTGAAASRSLRPLRPCTGVASRWRLVSPDGPTAAAARRGPDRKVARGRRSAGERWSLTSRAAREKDCGRASSRTAPEHCSVSRSDFPREFRRKTSRTHCGLTSRAFSPCFSALVPDPPGACPVFSCGSARPPGAAPLCPVCHPPRRQVSR